MLKQKLQADLKDAFKSGDSDKKSTIGMVLAAVKSREIEKRAKFAKSEPDATKLEELSQLTDDEIMEAVSSEIKKRKDSVSQYESAGRPELADKEKKEIAILVAYLPEQMSEADIKSIVEQTKSEVGASSPKDMGKLIASVMAKVKGKADGTLVSKLVKESLS